MANFFYTNIVKTNLFIGISACSFYLTGSFLMQDQPDFPSINILAVLFLSTFVIYSISQKPFSMEIFFPKKISFDRLALMLAMLLIIYLSYGLSKEIIVVLGILGVISFLYNAIGVKKNFFIPLRSIPLLKVFLISFVWAGVGVVLPSLSVKSIDSQQFVVLILSQFFFILSITLPFDIRDFYKDIKNKLKTLPGVIGIKNTKILAYTFLGAHTIGFLILEPYIIYIYLPFSGMVFLFIKNANASKPNYYYIFLIDGLIIIQLLVVYCYTILLPHV